MQVQHRGHVGISLFQRRCVLARHVIPHHRRQRLMKRKLQMSEVAVLLRVTPNKHQTQRCDCAHLPHEGLLRSHEVLRLLKIRPSRTLLKEGVGVGAGVVATAFSKGRVTGHI